MKKTTITITTAQKLSDAQRKEIITMLTPKVGDVVIEEVIDSTVIGGFKLKIGDQDFDVTTAGKLAALESQLPQVKVVTAVPLSASERKQVQDLIYKKMEKAEIIEIVDQEIIGGIKIVFPSEEYDGSIKGKVDKLKAYMMNNI